MTVPAGAALREKRAVSPSAEGMLSAMSAAFDEFTDAYEAMIDWKARLAREEPFYRYAVNLAQARKVLDTACGTGHHAAMFHSWGLRVEAADRSATMIRRCRRLHGSPRDLRWVVRSFDRPVDAPGTFDLAICVGNSLALAPDRRTVARAIRMMLAAVRPGGWIVVHVLNLWRLPDGPAVWQKCRRVSLDGRDSIIVKGVHRAGRTGYVNMIVATLEADAPQMRHESTALLGLEAGELKDMAASAGASIVRFFGDYQKHPYRRRTSEDMIMLARRG